MGRIREVVGEALLVPRKDAIRKVSLPSRLALSSNLLGMKVSMEMSFAVVWKVEGSRVGRDFQVICSEFNNLQRSERLSAELGRQTTARVSKATRFVTLNKTRQFAMRSRRRRRWVLGNTVHKYDLKNAAHEYHDEVSCTTSLI